ncbi:NAD kinase isoform X1, partial [Clarias magur]
MRIRTYPRAHILQTFQRHCETLAANGNAGYQEEFEELSDAAKEFSCRAGELDANKNKNRYPFILPYDHCRVKLSLLESQPHSDYINASYVPGGCTEHDFICTQAPLPSTIADFWRMVWEQNVQVIVMVTSLKEYGKVLCNQYWPPERGTGCYGALQVTTVSRHRGPDCYITTIHLRQHGSPTDRRITHYYYPGWLDQGVPKHHTSLVKFTEHVRKQLDDTPNLGPTVVHCSAGIGRSGTFVAILWLIQLCVRGILPDVRLAVRDLRRHRVLMVQNVEQYILVHQCILHWLGGNMERPSIVNGHRTTIWVKPFCYVVAVYKSMVHVSGPCSVLPLPTEVSTPEDDGIFLGEDNCPSYSQDNTFPGPLLSNKMQIEELISFIQIKTQECLQHADKPDQKETYYFWKIMELLCCKNGKVLLADVGTLLFRNYRLLRKKLRAIKAQDSWCLLLARLLCSALPVDKLLKAVVEMGEMLDCEGLTYSAHVCYVVAMRKLESFQGFSFLLIGCSRSPVNHPALREAIERTEMYEYIYCKIFGFAQPSFQIYKYYHANKLAEFGFRNQAFEYCKTIARAITTFPREITKSTLEMTIELCERLHQGKGKEPEWLADLRRLHKENMFKPKDVEYGLAHHPPHLESHITSWAFESLYTMGELLGEGGFGSICAGVRKADGKQVAIKYVVKGEHDIFITMPGETQLLPMEVALMEMVSKPFHCDNVLELIEWFEMPDCFILILERPSPCVDLRQFVHSHKGRLSEPVAQNIMRQVVQAARHCCECGVLHRDIKAENLLVNTDTLQVKLIDFGCGDLLKDTPYTVYAGTRVFCPPEWLCEGEYHGLPATIWGLGILLFDLVCGDVPFHREEDIVNRKINFAPGVSGDCINLILWCLARYPHARPTFDEILSHAWFVEPQDPQNVKNPVNSEMPALLCHPEDSHITPWEVFESLYTPVKLLGERGFAAVCEGVRNADGRKVVIKYVGKSPKDKFIIIMEGSGESNCILKPETACTSCGRREPPSLGKAFRNKPKARSMSTSSVPSCAEFRRTQSLHGPSPVTTFGPKACMMKNPKAVMHIQDPASQRLTWNKPPQSVLVIKKIQDVSLLQPFKELCIFLTEQKKMMVYVERKVLEDPAIANDESFVAVKKSFCTFSEDYDDISNRVDFIICLGGDGTLLYASSLFQESVPPVMPFHLGSLGFLTPFNFDTYQSQVTQVIEGNAAIILRSRLKVKVMKEPRPKEKNAIIANGDAESGRRTMQYQVLNEVVVDRGPSSYLSNVDLFLDGHLITTVQGDGVIVSTPTGSTAYAVAAGASMIHPNVPAIMITPICPHSLSFRPIVVPAGVELKIMLSREARNNAWVSFDGRKRQEIGHGD